MLRSTGTEPALDAPSRETAAAVLPAELSVVVPTFNEAANVEILVGLIDQALQGVRWEVIFVDDNSPDGTAEKIRTMAQLDPRVRIVHRFDRRGLSSACVEGMLASAAPYVAVMDSDLQHDEKILRAMLDRLRAGDIDLVVGSRYVEGGGVGEWDRKRAAASLFATRIASRLTRTPINDPMSGFFMLTRGAFMSALPKLSSVGFKVLLDIAASAPEPLRVAEVPYTFRTRQFGESKLDSLVLWEYLQLLLDKTFGHILPVRFLSFALVGGVGLALHFLVLVTLFKGLHASFAVAQTTATILAISNNFFLNNLLTYRDQRLKGTGLLLGWLSFNLVCAMGAAANIGIAQWLFVQHTSWVFSAITGVLISVVWNYAMSSLFTWRRW